ncbi:MAG: hypothetical protein HKN49_11680 [Gammaproteobacteria bacterium]|nr:hypothetical protein [Gammaproteobacteria bacterium]
MIRLMFTLVLVASIAPAFATPPGAGISEARERMTAPVSAENEQRLLQIVRDFAAHPDDISVRALVSELAGREPQVYVRHTEGPMLVPLVDVGAYARYLLTQWERAATSKQVTARAAKGEPGLVEAYLAAKPHQRQAMTDAIEALPVEELIVYRESFLAAAGKPSSTAMVAAAALRLTDAQLLRTAIEKGEGKQLQRFVPSIRPAFDSVQAARLLDAVVIHHPELASMAILEIGAINDAGADKRIWSYLADTEHGGSAAAVLARRGDSTTVQRLLELADSAPDRLLRQRARLALRLHSDPSVRKLADGADR